MVSVLASCVIVAACPRPPPPPRPGAGAFGSTTNAQEPAKFGLSCAFAVVAAKTRERAPRIKAFRLICIFPRGTSVVRNWTRKFTPGAHVSPECQGTRCQGTRCQGTRCQGTRCQGTKGRDRRKPLDMAL